jgi:hypothetical protein
VFGIWLFLFSFCTVYILIFSPKCSVRISLFFFCMVKVFSQTYVNSTTFLDMESSDVKWKILFGNAELPQTWDMIYEIQLLYVVLFVTVLKL